MKAGLTLEFLGIRNFVQALDQCPHQDYTLVIQGHVKGSESLGQATSPHPVSMLGARGALASQLSSPCFLLLQTNRPQSRACVCDEDSQVLGGLELAGGVLELGVLPSPGRSGGSWGLYACGFPAEQHAQGPGANWEQVADLANAAELVADRGVGWVGLVP